MEFDKSPNLKYQAVTVNSAKENCGNPQKFYIVFRDSETTMNNKN